MPDLTTAEMRDLQVELVELLAVQNKPMKRWSPLLDVLDEALARREREEEPCAVCGRPRSECSDWRRREWYESPVTDGEGG